MAQDWGSEIIGSFIRRSSSPLEADYVFNTVADLDAWASVSANQRILHDGLIKTVKADEEGKQAMYVARMNPSTGIISFSKLHTDSYWEIYN